MWLVIINAVVGIIGVLFGIFIGLRSKQVYRPALMFNSGLILATDISKSDRKFLEKNTTSALIYGVTAPKNSEVVFACPYLFINNSKLPIYNITLQLEYATRHAIENALIIRGGIDYGFIFKMNPDYCKERAVDIFDSIAHIRYTIPILRAGEKICIFDVMKRISSK